MYGREARAPNEEYFESLKRAYPNWITYAKQLHDGLQYCWLIASDKKAVQDVHRNVPPVKPRPFKEYKVGDRFYWNRVPKRLYHRKGTDNVVEQLRVNAKLQPRFVGPFEIVEKITPVLYVANINGKHTRVHAIRMKPE
jgi:hypothetical protein